MSDQHTAGDWKVGRMFSTHNHPERYWDVVCFVDKVGLVATGHGATQEEAETNARLIAAAPTMLAALKAYLEWGAMTSSDRDLFDRRFRAAIAKAEATS